MMKKLEYLIVLIALLTCQSTYAHDFVVNGIYYNFVEGSSDKVEVTYQGSYCGSYLERYTGNIVIPSKVFYKTKFYNVTSIGSHAFQGCSKLTSITIPNTIWSINEYSFCECEALKTVEIPESITVIASGAFSDCSSLESVDLPSGLVSIYKSAFSECTSLKEIVIPNSTIFIQDYAFLGCTGLETVEVGDSVTSIGAGIFNDCTSLREVKLGNALQSIGERAFWNCPKLETINIGDNVQTVGEEAFAYCTSLKHLKFPASLTSIGDDAFKNTNMSYLYLASTSLKKSLATSISCPIFVEHETIWNAISAKYAKKGSLTCDNLVGYYYTPTGYADGNVTLHLYALSDDYYIQKGIQRAKDGISVDSLSNKGDGHYSCKIWNCMPDSHYEAKFVLRSKMGRAESFSVGITTPKPYLYIEADSIAYSIIQFEVLAQSMLFEYGTMYYPQEIGVEYNGNMYKAVKDDSEDLSIGRVTISKLAPSKTLMVRPYAVYKDSVYYGEYGTWNTLSAGLTYTGIEKGQTWIKFTGLADNVEDADCRYSEIGILYNKNHIKVDKDGNATLTGLIPGQNYVPAIYAIYNAIEVSSSSVKVRTNTITPQIKITKVGPTSIKGTLSYYIEDGITLVSQKLNGEEFSDKSFEICQLDPASKRSLSCSVTISLPTYTQTLTYYGDASATTSALEWTTLPAKATSNTVALLAATTNIDDDEAVTGFEWRRYDAPDLVPSTQSACPVIDGELIGALKNLSANTYYKFRPYYTSATGNTYYGEWLAFGTADAYVYFDPTVKTYSASDIAESSAKIRGYVISGSGNIIKQGFEYWVVKQNANGMYATTTNGVTVVAVDGTKMSTVLTGLVAGTTYAYRAFATTSEGTIYGEEQTFTTTNTTGIVAATTDANDGEMSVSSAGSVQRGDVTLTVSGTGEPTTWTAYTLMGVTIGGGTIAADGVAHSLGLAPQQGVVIVRVRNAHGVKTLKLR